MNTTPRTSKVASLLASLTACLGLTLGSTGCFFVAGGGGSGNDGAVVATTDPTTGPTTDPSTPAVPQLAIDPGVTMTSDPGNGVGLYVQYDQGGHWSLLTTCDTNITGTSCKFDVVLSAAPGVALDNVQGVDLQASDSVTLGTDGSISLVTDTSTGTNGIMFDAEAGAVVEVDMLLDGVAQPRFVYLVSDGAVLDGVPANPVDLAPSAP